MMSEDAEIEGRSTPDTFRSDAEADEYAFAYYADPSDPGTQVLIRRLFRLFQERPGARVLDFGCGPTVYVPLLAGRSAHEVLMWDPSPRALGHVHRWIGGEYDRLWAPYADFVAQQVADPLSSADVLATARCCTRVLPGDPRRGDAGLFDVVVANFSLEADSKPIGQWVNENSALTGLLKPGGTYFATFLVGAQTWQVREGITVDATTLRESDVGDLAETLRLQEADVEMVHLDRALYDGFVILTGLMPDVRT